MQPCRRTLARTRDLSLWESFVSRNIPDSLRQTASVTWPACVWARMCLCVCRVRSWAWGSSAGSPRGRSRPGSDAEGTRTDPATPRSSAKPREFTRDPFWRTETSDPLKLCFLLHSWRFVFYLVAFSAGLASLIHVSLMVCARVCMYVYSHLLVICLADSVVLGSQRVLEGLSQTGEYILTRLTVWLLCVCVWFFVFFCRTTETMDSFHYFLLESKTRGWLYNGWKCVICDSAPCPPAIFHLPSFAYSSFQMRLRLLYQALETLLSLLCQ